MGLDNISNTYKIVHVSQPTALRMTMLAPVYVLGTSSWREIDSVPPCDLNNNKASAYGDMHRLVFEDKEFL